MGRIGRQMAAVTRASLKIGLFRVELQRQYPPCLIKQFVITMCERALSSERSQDHGRILQDCSSTCQSFRRGRCAASPGRPFRRKRQGVQRMLKFPCEQLVEGENKDPILRLFSISYTFRARCPLSRCGLAATFEVADVNESSHSTLLAALFTE